MTDCKNVNVCWNSEKSSKIGINYETIMLKVLRAMHKYGDKYDFKIIMEDMNKELIYRDIHLSEVCDMLMKIKKC
jgi:hypothetical protein